MATYEGMGLCKPVEYHESFAARLEIDQITRGELYVARFKIEGLKVGFRILGRVGLATLTTAQPTDLDFQMFNDDMQPLDIPPDGEMVDSVWNSKKGIEYQNRPGAKCYDLRDGCFAHYDENGDNGLMAEFQLLLDRELDLHLISPSYVHADQS